MRKLTLFLLLLLTGCATYQPRTGYKAVVTNISTDNVMIQNPSLTDPLLVVALRNNIEEEIVSRIRKEGTFDPITTCQPDALKFKGSITSISVTTEEKSSGVFHREHQEFKDYKVTMRGILEECKTGKAVDDIELKESDGEIQKVASDLSRKIARFIRFTNE